MHRRADAIALPELHAAHTDGRIRLSLHVSDEGTRLATDQLTRLVDRDHLRSVHVSVCGPHSLVAAVQHAARRHHAAHVHTEDFDIRQGFGPDLSTEIDQLVRSRTARRQG